MHKTYNLRSKTITTNTTCVRLDKDTRDRLEMLSKIRDKTPNYLMKVAVKHYLDFEETEFEIVKARLEKYELTGESINHGDVKNWAKSLGQTKDGSV